MGLRGGGAHTAATCAAILIATVIVVAAFPPLDVHGAQDTDRRRDEVHGAARPSSTCTFLVVRIVSASPAPGATLKRGKTCITILRATCPARWFSARVIRTSPRSLAPIPSAARAWRHAAVEGTQATSTRTLAGGAGRACSSALTASVAASRANAACPVAVAAAWHATLTRAARVPAGAASSEQLAPRSNHDGLSGDQPKGASTCAAARRWVVSACVAACLATHVDRPLHDDLPSSDH